MLPIFNQYSLNIFDMLVVSIQVKYVQCKDNLDNIVILFEVIQ